MRELWKLPNSWLLITIDEVCDFHAGFGFPTKMQGNAGQALPFYKVKDVSVAWKAQSMLLLDTDNSLSYDEANLIKAKPVPTGAVVFAKIGEALRLNRRAIVSKPSLIDNNLMGISAPPTRLAIRYLYWFSIATKFDVDARASVVPSIRKSDIGNLPLPLPPAAEQTRIVEKLEELLSDLDAGVAELKAAQKKLVQYRQSLLKAAVEGALTAEWRTTNLPKETGAQLLQRILIERRARWEAKQLAKFKEQGKAPPKDWRNKYPEPVKPDTSDLPELPNGWFYCHLEAFIQSDKTGTKTGPFGSLLKKYEHKKTGVPVIGIENIDRMKFISGSKIHISPEKAEELRDYDLLPGDVVISRSGTVGEVCVIPDDLGDARFSTNIMRVRLENRIIEPKFFCLLLNGSPYVLSQIRELCSGSTRDFLNTEILKKLIFPVPPILEQTAILNLLNLNLDAVEDQNHALFTSLKQSAAQRKNILKAAFSGQLVPQDPNDEPASVLLERIRAERATQEKAPKSRGRKSKETT